MTSQDDYLVDAAEASLYTELTAPDDRVKISLNTDDADTLENPVTQAGRKAFLKALFDELDVPSRENWTPLEAGHIERE